MPGELSFGVSTNFIRASIGHFCIIMIPLISGSHSFESFHVCVLCLHACVCVYTCACMRVCMYIHVCMCVCTPTDYNVTVTTVNVWERKGEIHLASLCIPRGRGGVSTQYFQQL